MAYLTAALLVFLTFVPTFATSSQDPKAGDLKIEPYVFDGGGQKVDAELGHLLVPENRKNPDSKLIELAFVRFKSTAKNPEPPIIYLAGGPGGSGIGAARGTRFPLFMAMREIADVIAFDQRATGMSRPSLECSESLGYPLDKPGEPTELIRLYQERARACALALKQKGIDVSAYNTNESADDLEDLRKALGAEKISLWSISYGTHLSFAAIRRHERSIHRVILAGVEGPAQTWKLPSNIQQNLENISQLVSRDPQVGKRVPDLIALMTKVLNDLEKQPIKVQVIDSRSRQSVDVTLGKFDLQRFTASVIGNSEVIGIPTLYDALLNNNLNHTLVKQLAQAVRRERQGPLGSTMPLAMDCASSADAERLRRIEQQARNTLLGSAIDFPFPGICEGFPNLDLGASFRAPLKTKVPALFISGTLDARTPVSNAEEVRRGFSNSMLLIIDGAVHSDPLFLSSPRIKDVMLEFMKGQRVSITSVSAVPLRFSPLLKSRSAADTGSAAEEWKAVLEVGTQKLRLVLNLEKSRSGIWTAELLSPDQGNAIVPVDSITFDGSRMQFDMSLIGSRYDGQLNSDHSEISGHWIQNGVGTPLNFKRSSGEIK